MRAWLFAAALGVAAEGTMAGPPAVTDMVVSEAKNGSAKATFKTTTPKVFIRAKLVDIPAGAKMRVDWIAAKTAVAPPNYKVDSLESTVAKGMTRYDGSLSKPTAGWPEGDYRVDLFIDGKAVKQATFKVVK